MIVSLDGSEKSATTLIPSNISTSTIAEIQLVSPSEKDIPSDDQHDQSDTDQKDLYFVAHVEHDNTSAMEKVDTAIPPAATPILSPPPVSVRPTKAEKDFEVSVIQEEVSESDVNNSGRNEVRLSTLRRLSLRWITAYRVLIGTTLVINAVILGLINGLHLPLTGVLTGTAANLFVAVLVRQEDLINLSFGLVAMIPSTLPLSIRKRIADFHHYGGVHIGCAISSLMWYCLFIALNTTDFIHVFKDGSVTPYHWVDIITCYLFLTFIILICVTAHPKLRTKLHNCFERVHRFGGWFSLVVLWINTGIHTKLSATGLSSLHESPSLWLLAFTTFLIVLPWLRIRRVTLHATAISNREVRLTFPHTNMPHTSTMRFSSSPLTEWHAFATIPSSSGDGTADIIVSAAGDWTKALISSPPPTLWIRHPPTKNFLSFTPLFNSVLLIGTGAGIGPLLSLLQSPTIGLMRSQGKTVRVMWCVYDPYAPHWDFVVKIIKAVDPVAMIIDSKMGRPNVAWEAGRLVRCERLEACMVVSNEKVTRSVIREVKGKGGVAYGAVFDS